MISDPARNSVVLFLPMFGVNGNHVFVDYGPSQRPVSRIGSGVTIANAQSRFYGVSALFNGANSNALSVPAHADFNVGSGDFTVEAWLYPTAYPAAGAWRAVCSNYADANNSGWRLLVGDDGRLHLSTAVGGPVGTDKPLQLNQWAHAAVSRVGGVCRLFVGGEIAGAQASISTISNSTSAFYLGSTNGTAWPFSGYMQDFRLTKGLGRYVEDFTPPDRLLDFIFPAYQRPYVLHGTVKNREGVFAARMVTALRQSDHSRVATVLSDPDTGEWEIATPFSEPHILLFDGELTRNSLVFGGVMPE